MSYSPVRHSQPRIAAGSPVRLACVRHAASVHPEPGSNSPSSLAPTPVLRQVPLTGSSHSPLGPLVPAALPVTLLLLRCRPSNEVFRATKPPFACASGGGRNIIENTMFSECFGDEAAPFHFVQLSEPRLGWVCSAPFSFERAPILPPSQEVVKGDSLKFRKTERKLS